MQQYLSFNDTQGERFLLYPEEESPEALAALREVMPLRTGWTLWEQVSSGNYATRKVVAFNTVQDFWAVWNGVPQPSELLENKRLFSQQPNGQPAQPLDAIMIFREGISPEWEDNANANGGHFQICMKPTAGPGQID